MKKRLFIVGAAKSGTTTLYHHLKQHPELFFSPVKEPNFYARAEPRTRSEAVPPKPGLHYHSKIIRSREVYESLFEAGRKSGYSYLCEASTSYLFDSEAAGRIYSDYPDARILVMLRNPVKRAYSHYRMYRNSGVEPNPDFLGALQRDMEVPRKIWGRDAGYIDLGRYSTQLQEYYRHFHPSQIEVMVFEDYIRDIPGYLHKLAEFLGIDPEGFRNVDPAEKFNEAASPRNALVKFLFKLKNQLYFISEWMPGGIKRWLMSRFFSPEAPREIDPEAAALIRRELRGEMESLNAFIPADQIEKYLL